MYKENRNYGIDLLRIIAMIFIVILHCLGHGGGLKASSVALKDYKISLFLEVVAYSAVDIFGIISGYVMSSRKKVKYSNLIIFWLEVVFYGVAITTMFNIYDSSIIKSSDYVKALMPISYKYYWYITAYFGMMIISPFILNSTENISKNFARKALIVIILVFSIIETLFKVFQLNNGYSTLWLIILFIIGILIRKSELNFKKSHILSGIIILTIFTWYYCIFGLESNGLININKFMFLSYVSPTILTTAILYLLFFENIKFNNHTNKVIKYFSTSSLSIYLLNDNPIIRLNVISGHFVKYYEKGEIYMIIQILIFTFIFIVASILIDKIRIFIFERLNIKNAIKKIGIE